MAMINCFLVPGSLLEAEAFKTSTARQRCWLLWLASEFSARGEFYMSDTEMATILHVSLATARVARRRFSRLGWVDATPGFRCRNRNLATRYKAIGCLLVQSGEPAVAVHRHALAWLLHCVRRGTLTHADVVTYVSLDFLRSLHTEAGGDRLTVRKDELAELTALRGVLGCVAHLHDGLLFAGNRRLFTYVDQGDTLLFSAWTRFTDPSTDETAKKSEERFRSLIKAEVFAAYRGRAAGQDQTPQDRRTVTP